MKRAEFWSLSEICGEWAFWVDKPWLWCRGKLENGREEDTKEQVVVRKTRLHHAPRQRFMFACAT